jgi:oxysterol-binding protein 1
LQANNAAGVEESIKTFKLLEGPATSYLRLADCVALRANDRASVDEALKLYASSSKCSSLERPRQTIANDMPTPLHLAIQCAPAQMVEYILSKGTIDLNAKNKQGNTVLHLAAMQGRDDVVELLLLQPDIDDSIVNNQGKQVSGPKFGANMQPFEVAETPDLVLSMQCNPPPLPY